MPRKTRMCCSCGYLYAGDSRRRTCPECGAARKPKHKQKHMAALEESYWKFVERNGDVERCGICRAEPKPGRNLHRDHNHRTGAGRGLLCFRCNAALRPYMDRQWLEAAAAYLARLEQPLPETPGPHIEREAA
jgi:hypothetical protein